MKILFRYIQKQYLINLLLGLTIFTFVLMLDHLFELVDLLINKGVGFGLTLELLFLLLPSSLTLTLPMSHLLSALLTFGHFSETSEITAIRASGISPWRYVHPPLMIAGLTVLFLIPFNTIWAPHTHTKFRKLYFQVLQRNPLVRIEEKTFIDIGDYHLYVDKKNASPPHLHGITIYKTPIDGAPLRIFADHGEASVNPYQGVRLLLQEGRMEEVDTQHPDEWYFTSFKTYNLVIPFQNQKPETSRAIQEMDNADLNNEISQLRAKHLPFPVFECEKQLRWALAVSPFLFVLLGIPLAVRVQRGGRSIGFAISLIVVLVYYIAVMSGLSMAQRGSIPPILGVWMGNALMLVVALEMNRRFLTR